MKRKTRKKTRRGGVTMEEVRSLALSFPGVEEATSYGTVAFRVNRKLFLRFHQDGESLDIRVEKKECEHWLTKDPDVYCLTPNYIEYSWILARQKVIRRRRVAIRSQSGVAFVCFCQADRFFR